MDEETGTLDGCYLTLDTLRDILLRAGMAERGKSRRWKEHERASLLKDESTKSRGSYYLYPHQNVPEDQAPNRRGTFQQLQQRSALGIKKTDRSRILELFQWSEIDEAHLSKLSYAESGAGTLEFKKYKHLCYMFELFFAVCLEPSKNVTENPTCEWQLRLYSKKN